MKARAVFAWNLRRLRLEREISQEDLAHAAYVDRAYISELERKRGNATLDLIDKLSAVLKVQVSEFFLEPQAGVRLKPLKTGRPARKSRARKN
jgi:transcriptional regulator with XRE-family HTH domain